MRTLLVMVAVVLAACATREPYQPTTVRVPTEDAYARSTRVLIERGESIETKDEDAGVLITKWEEDKSMGTFYRMRWKVTVADGNVTVVSQCQWKADVPGTPEWKDCDTQPEGRSGKGRAIAEAIAR